ncbi:MAG: BLUF domain-containing protein [Actinoplanes sp.]
MTMSRLIYFSEKRELGSGGIEAILSVARRKNERNALTGVLLFNRNYFLQCLEGGRQEVTATFCRIAADPRHGNVTLVSAQDIDVRDFPDWTMGYVPSTSPQVNALLREFVPTEDFNPEALSSTSAIVLMGGMRSIERTV